MTGCYELGKDMLIVLHTSLQCVSILAQPLRYFCDCMCIHLHANIIWCSYSTHEAASCLNGACKSQPPDCAWFTPMLGTSAALEVDLLVGSHIHHSFLILICLAAYGIAIRNCMICILSTLPVHQMYIVLIAQAACSNAEDSISNSIAWKSPECCNTCATHVMFIKFIAAHYEDYRYCNMSEGKLSPIASDCIDNGTNVRNNPQQQFCITCDPKSDLLTWTSGLWCRNSIQSYQSYASLLMSQHPLDLSPPTPPSWQSVLFAQPILWNQESYASVMHEPNVDYCDGQRKQYTHITFKGNFLS